MQALRERFATLVDVDRAAADGDFVVIDLVAQSDGETVEGAELTGMSYKVGRGGMLDGLDEALAGMTAGEEKTFSSQLVGGDLVGQDVDVVVKVDKVQEQELPDVRRRVRPAGLGVRHRRGALRGRPRAARPGQAPRAGRRRARRRPRGAARARRRSRCPETVVADELNSRRQNIEQQLALRRHHHGQVPRGRGPDGRGVRGRPRAPRPRRRRRPAAPRRGRHQGGARRRPGRAPAAPLDAGPAVRPGPAGVRQPHVRAQPHPRAGAGDPPRQGARPDRGVGDRHRRVRQRGRAEEPAARRHHRRAGRRVGARPTRRPRPSRSPRRATSRRRPRASDSAA